MRAPLVLSLALSSVVLACGGTQVPQHSGYKGKKPTPWTKAKVIELDDQFTAKVEGELDYGDYKRAKWFALTLPGPGTLDVTMEAVPANDREMDVALEVLDPNFHVVARADQDADDVNEQKKQRTLPDLDEGTYLLHVYLQGRLDAADFELRLKFVRGDKPWKSDFPNQVSFVDELPTVPPLDDTPAKPVKVVKTSHKVRRIKTAVTPTTPAGKQPILADITDVQDAGGGSGSKITIGGGTSDGLADGMRGSVTGVRSGGGFTLSACTPNRCQAKVKAEPAEVREQGTVIIRP